MPRPDAIKTGATSSAIPVSCAVERCTGANILIQHGACSEKMRRQVLKTIKFACSRCARTPGCRISATLRGPPPAAVNTLIPSEYMCGHTRSDPTCRNGAEGGPSDGAGNALRRQRRGSRASSARGGRGSRPGGKPPCAELGVHGQRASQQHRRQHRQAGHLTHPHAVGRCTARPSAALLAAYFAYCVVLPPNCGANGQDHRLHTEPYITRLETLSAAKHELAAGQSRARVAMQAVVTSTDVPSPAKLSAPGLSFLHALIDRVHHAQQTRPNYDRPTLDLTVGFVPRSDRRVLHAQTADCFVFLFPDVACAALPPTRLQLWEYPPTDCKGRLCLANESRITAPLKINAVDPAVDPRPQCVQHRGTHQLGCLTTANEEVEPRCGPGAPQSD